MTDMKSRLREEEPRKESTSEGFGKKFRASYSPSLTCSQNGNLSPSRRTIRLDFSLDNFKKGNSNCFNNSDSNFKKSIQECEINGLNGLNGFHSHSNSNYSPLQTEAKTKSTGWKESSTKKKIDGLISDFASSGKSNYLNGNDNLTSKGYGLSGMSNQSTIKSTINQSREYSSNNTNMSVSSSKLNMQTKLRREIELFSKSLKDEKPGQSRQSYINRPALSLNKPDLEMNQKNYLEFSPTKVRKNSMVKSTHVRSYNSGSFLKGEQNKSGFNLQISQSMKTNQNTPTQSYIKLSRPVEKLSLNEEVDDFGKDLGIIPRKESYIQKYSPKKRKMTADMISGRPSFLTYNTSA